MNYVKHLKSSQTLWAHWLMAGVIFCLIFDNIPKFLQLDTVSSGFSCKISWYFLSLLMVLWIYQLCKGNFIISREERLFIYYILSVSFIAIFSNIWGLWIYPYYDELLLA